MYKEVLKKTDRLTCKYAEAMAQRDIVAKTLYESLFVWLLEKLNSITSTKELIQSKEENIKSMGVLDICGFEYLDVCGYEQLIINYADEKLQKLYLTTIFDMEKTIFKEEGLNELENSIVYVDNTTPVIMLLENKIKGKPIGIFNKIEEYKKNDDFINLLGAMTKDYKDCKCYEKHKQRDKFIVKHTFKDVVYTAKDFIEKNFDKTSDFLKSFLMTKLAPEIGSIFKVIFNNE